LGELDVPVFYDRDFEAQYLGEGWAAEFGRIFGEGSRYVLCILDKNHLEKHWPTFEREHFTPRVKDASVIPIFLDESRFVGIPQDIVGIKFNNNLDDSNWAERVDNEIVLKTIDKLQN